MIKNETIGLQLEKNNREYCKSLETKEFLSYSSISTTNGKFFDCVYLDSNLNEYHKRSFRENEHRGKR